MAAASVGGDNGPKAADDMLYLDGVSLAALQAALICVHRPIMTRAAFPAGGASVVDQPADAEGEKKLRNALTSAEVDACTVELLRGFAIPPQQHDSILAATPLDDLLLLEAQQRYRWVATGTHPVCRPTDFFEADYKRWRDEEVATAGKLLQRLDIKNTFAGGMLAIRVTEAKLKTPPIVPRPTSLTTSLTGSLSGLFAGGGNNNVPMRQVDTYQDISVVVSVDKSNRAYATVRGGANPTLDVPAVNFRIERAETTAVVSLFATVPTEDDDSAGGALLPGAAGKRTLIGSAMVGIKKLADETVHRLWIPLMAPPPGAVLKTGALPTPGPVVGSVRVVVQLKMEEATLPDPTTLPDLGINPAEVYTILADLFARPVPSLAAAAARMRGLAKSASAGAAMQLAAKQTEDEIMAEMMSGQTSGYTPHSEVALWILGEYMARTGLPPGHCAALRLESAVRRCRAAPSSSTILLNLYQQMLAEPVVLHATTTLWTSVSNSLQRIVAGWLKDFRRVYPAGAGLHLDSALRLHIMLPRALAQMAHRDPPSDAENTAAVLAVLVGGAGERYRSIVPPPPTADHLITGCEMLLADARHDLDFTQHAFNDWDIDTVAVNARTFVQSLFRDMNQWLFISLASKPPRWSVDALRLASKAYATHQSLSEPPFPPPGGRGSGLALSIAALRPAMLRGMFHAVFYDWVKDAATILQELRTGVLKQETPEPVEPPRRLFTAAAANLMAGCKDALAVLQRNPAALIPPNVLCSLGAVILDVCKGFVDTIVTRVFERQRAVRAAMEAGRKRNASGPSALLAAASAALDDAIMKFTTDPEDREVESSEPDLSRTPLFCATVNDVEHVLLQLEDLAAALEARVVALLAATPVACRPEDAAALTGEVAGVKPLILDAPLMDPLAASPADPLVPATGDATVPLVPAPSESSTDPQGTTKAVDATETDYIWENQRRQTVFTPFTRALPQLFGEAAFCRTTGEVIPEPRQVAPPAGWTWLGEWLSRKSVATPDAVLDPHATDADGWAYAEAWEGPWRASAGETSLVRRRLWARERRVVREVPLPAITTVAELMASVPPETAPPVAPSSQPTGDVPPASVPSSEATTTTVETSSVAPDGNNAVSQGPAEAVAVSQGSADASQEPTTVTTVVPAGAAATPGASQDNNAPRPVTGVVMESVVEEVFRNQRRSTLFHPFAAKFLLATDRPEFSDREGAPLASPPDIVIPTGWTWSNEWTVDNVSGGVGDDGWGYAFAFNQPTSREPTASSWVRVQRWVRTRTRPAPPPDPNAPPKVVPAPAPQLAPTPSTATPTTPPPATTVSHAARVERQRNELRAQAAKQAKAVAAASPAAAAVTPKAPVIREVFTTPEELRMLSASTLSFLNNTYNSLLLMGCARATHALANELRSIVRSVWRAGPQPYALFPVEVEKRVVGLVNGAAFTMEEISRDMVRCHTAAAARMYRHMWTTLDNALGDAVYPNLQQPLVTGNQIDIIMATQARLAAVFRAQHADLGPATTVATLRLANAMAYRADTVRDLVQTFLRGGPLRTGATLDDIVDVIRTRSRDPAAAHFLAALDSGKIKRPPTAAPPAAPSTSGAAATTGTHDEPTAPRALGRVNGALSLPDSTPTAFVEADYHLVDAVLLGQFVCTLEQPAPEGSDQPWRPSGQRGVLFVTETHLCHASGTGLGAVRAAYPFQEVQSIKGGEVTAPAPAAPSAAATAAAKKAPAAAPAGSVMIGLDGRDVPVTMMRMTKDGRLVPMEEDAIEAVTNGGKKPPAKKAVAAPPPAEPARVPTMPSAPVITKSTPLIITLLSGENLVTEAQARSLITRLAAQHSPTYRLAARRAK